MATYNSTTSMPYFLSSDELFVFNAIYPFLRAALKKSDGTSEEVAVYVKTGFWTSKVKICVGGKIVFNKAGKLGVIR